MEKQNESGENDIRRRDFLKAGALTVGTFMIVPRHVLGKGFIPPSDKLNIAAVGCGGKADVNIRLAYNNGAENIVALCDVDDRQSEKYRKQFPNAPYYKDYRKMFEKEAKNMDAVIVTTPDHMHFPIAMAAMELGKHVYVEKPLTKDIWEARNLTIAAKKYKVVTQMGNQGSSSDGTRQTEALVQSGIIGDVHKIEVWTDRPVWPQGVQSPKDKGESQPIPQGVDWDLWLGTAPKRDYHEAYMPFRWRGYWDFGTGALGDMGCHFIDVPFRALKLGYPTSVECSVGSLYADFFEQAFFDDVAPPSASIHMKFASKTPGKDINFSWYDGGMRPQLPEGCDYKTVFGSVDGGMLFTGSKGILSAEMFGNNPRLWPEKKFETIRPNIKPRALVPGGSEGHQQQFVQACKKGPGTYTSSAFEESGPLTEIVLMGNLAVRSYLHREPKADGKGGFNFPGRQKLIWDGANMKITNFDVANRFVKREYRTGW